MPRTPNADAPPEPGPAPEPEDTTEPIDDTEPAVELQNWEFAGQPPTGDDVRALLESLPDQWGVRPVDYINFVQPLPARKKIKVPVLDQNGEQRMNRGQPVTADQHIDVWTLYIGVAGRIAMLNAAAAINGWRVDLSPDPGAGSVGGFIESTPLEDLAAEGKSGRVVYREACSIWKAFDDGTEICLGSKTGTAWVPARGGSQAAGTNPFEKVETSARGRAIAAWGIGILPGSGVASLEEMRGAQQNQRQAQREPRQQAQGAPATNDPEVLRGQALTMLEEIRQLREQDHSEARANLAEYARRTFQFDTLSEDGEEILWDRWRPAHLQLLVQTLTTQLRKLRDTDSPI
jgi:hypothetical protein